MALALLAGPAAAQGIDVGGAAIPAVDPDPRSPLTLLSPRVAPAGAWSVGGLLELVGTPLVRHELHAPGELVAVPVIEGALGLRLGGGYSVSDRISVQGSVPVWLGTSGEAEGGLALGDLHLWAPVALIRPGGGEGLSAAAIPYLDLPTGAAERYLGDRHLRAGLTGALSHWGPRVGVSGNLGLETGGRVTIGEQQLGGPMARLGVGFGLRLGERGVLHLETRSGLPLHSGARVDQQQAPRAAAPTEVLLTLKGQPKGRRWYAAGLGRGVTQAIGSSDLRMLVGMGWAHEPGAGELHPPEVLALEVVDPRGEPVAGAQLLVGGKVVGRAGLDGRLAVEPPRWRRGVEIRAPGYAGEALSPGEGEQRVTLGWEPRVAPLVARDGQGRPVQARWTVRSLEDAQAEVQTGELDAEGGGPALVPGRWRVELQAEGYGAQAREVLVPRGARPLRTAEFVLWPEAGDASLVHRITDPEGEPVPGARVLVDGRPVGTTGEGGLVEVAALAAGEHALEVQHEGFRAFQDPVVPLAAGDNLVQTDLKRVPGSVRVRVVDALGRPVPDAVVRFDGPSRLPPMSLGERGERLTALGPGSWSMLVVSASHGVQERQVVIDPERHELVQIEVVLLPQEQGDADLTVLVVDREGHPVEEAEIRLDGRSVGRTATGGSVRLQGLAAGPRAVEVVAEPFRERAPLQLHLVEGLQERVITLDWRAGSTRVRARAPSGPVEDAIVRFQGPEQRQTSPLGPVGEALYRLAPGSWEVVVSSEAYGVQSRGLHIEPDSRILHRVDILMQPEEGGLAALDLRVGGPDGRPVAGGEVLLDGLSVGRTGSAGRLALHGLSVGPRTVEVRAPLYRSATDRVRLWEGRHEHEVYLDWGPGAVRVVATGPQGPVRDAVVRMVGPQTLQPMTVDPQGALLVALDRGAWQAVVTSESHGIAQRPLEITGEEEGLTELEVPMVPVAEGTVDLMVRVEDADGRPIPGAGIELGPHDLGLTGEGGVLLVGGLPPGVAQLRIQADGFAPRQVGLDLEEGAQERILRLDFLPVPLTVQVADAQGQAVDAELVLVGPEEVAPVRTGGDGVAALEVRPGRWQVIASTDTLGPERVEVELAGEPQAVSLVLAPSRVRYTAEAVVIEETVAFDFDRATLRPDSGPVLDQVASTLLSHGEIVRVEVQGHTDDVGRVAYNQALSQRRAEAVVAALADRGVPREKLVARGYGTQRPLADNETEEGRATNRRVEFRILEQAGPRPGDAEGR